MALSQEEYGTFDLITAIVLFCVPVVTLKIETAAFKFIIEAKQDETKILPVISNTLSFTLWVCVAFALAIAAISPFLLIPFKHFLILNLVANLFFSVQQQIARGFQNTAVFALAGIIVSLCTPLFSILLVLGFQLGASGMLMGSLLAYAVGSLFLFIRLHLYTYLRWIWPWKLKVRELLRFSLPLVPEGLSLWVMNRSSSVIVSSILGVAANGLFAVAYKLGTALIAFSSVFGYAWSESLILHLREPGGEKFFNETMSTVLKLVFAASLLFLALMPLAFPLLVNEQFSAAYPLIPIFIGATVCCIVHNLYAWVYLTHGDTIGAVKSTILAAIVLILLNLLLVRWIGLYSAPFASLVAYLVALTYRIRDVRRHIVTEYNIRGSIEFILIYLILCVPYYINSLILTLPTIAVTAIYAVITNRAILIACLRIVREKARRRGI
jgi:O-antigen/teichoic acid export membrane protein